MCWRNWHEEIGSIGYSRRDIWQINFYGGIWTDYVMRDLQNYILRVIKVRCEYAPAVSVTK
jgi:hypothetical protein